jgi:hypothetical protein
MNDNKHGMERGIMEEFALYYPDFPKGKLVKSESPDFILKLGPRRAIGIELTTLPLPGVSQKNDSGEDPPERRVTLEEKVKDIIRMKENKLRLYRKKRSDLYWLVIAGNTHQYTGSSNPANKINTWNLSSGFNRVFLYDTVSKKVYVLTRQ